MNALRIDRRKFGMLFHLLLVASLAGCPPLPKSGGTPIGPIVGVIEMDQNTDPRFYLGNLRAAIGWLKVAGNAVRLNGKPIPKDTYIQNGDHISTGPASAAMIDFFPPGEERYRLDVRDFRHGRLYGNANLCGHMVVTDQGAMETWDRSASYHIEIRGDGVSVFTVINGQASVWRHSDPSLVVMVESYQQVELSHAWITPPRRVAPSEVDSITHWRKNFGPLREKYQTPRNSGSPPTVLNPTLLNNILKGAWKIFENSRSADRVNPPGRDRRPRVDSPSPDPGAEVKQAPTTPGKSNVVVPMNPRLLFPHKLNVVGRIVIVPDLKSKSLAEARRILKNLGLGLRYSPRDASDRYWVYGQNPHSGNQVERGGMVELDLRAPID